MLTRCLCAIVALAAGLSPFVEARLAAATPATSKWTRLRTPNFTILGDQGERPLRRVAERLEQFRQVIGRVFPSTQQPMPAPVIVHVFASERSYRPFMPIVEGKRIEVGGLFQQTASASYITLNAEAGEAAYPIVFKGYVHLLVGNALADVPTWFRTGLAEYYGTYEMFGQREATLGKVNEDHVLALRDRFLPLRELLAFDRLASLDRDEDRRRLFHAEAWALVHYLLIGNPQREGQLARYLEKYANGVPHATAARGLRRRRGRAGERAARLHPPLRLSVHPGPLPGQGSHRQGLDDRAADRGRRRGRLRRSVLCAAPTGRGGRPGRGGPAGSAGARPRPGGAGAHPVGGGAAGGRLGADRARREGGGRGRLSALLLPRAAAAAR